MAGNAWTLITANAFIALWTRIHAQLSRTNRSATFASSSLKAGSLSIQMQSDQP